MIISDCSWVSEVSPCSLGSCSFAAGTVKHRSRCCPSYGPPASLTSKHPFGRLHTFTVHVFRQRFILLAWIWLNYCSACDATCDFWCCTMHNINRKVVLEDLALYVEAWRKMEYQHISTVSCKTELHSEGISSNDSWVPVASVRYCMAFAAHVRRRTKVECLQRSRSVFLLTGPHNSNPHSLLFVNCFYIQAGSFGILFTSLTCFTGCRSGS